MPIRSLAVPHLQQNKLAWCLPACTAMISAYWHIPVTQEDMALWLGTGEIGTPSSSVQKLTRHGFHVFYGEGSVESLRDCIGNGTPSILFIRTGELAYWTVDTPHAVVVTGMDEAVAAICDPWLEAGPVEVMIPELLLAWSHFDYVFATLSPAH